MRSGPGQSPSHFIRWAPSCVPSRVSGRAGAVYRLGGMTETASSAVPADARSAYGYGVATIATGDGDATVLDVWFPAPALGTATESLRDVANADQSLQDIAATGADADRGTEQKVVFAQIHLDEAPADTADAYLRLHLLSHRLVQPNGINLDGIFGQLPNVVWTNFGPAAVEGFEPTRAPAARLRRRADRLRRGQVPPHGRLRHPLRRAHRRRRPGPPRRAPGRGHHGHARGLRELQRRHAGHVHGGGPHLRRCGRWGRIRRRRRRLDHGHAVRRRQGKDLPGRAGACSAPTPASASASATTPSSRPASTSRPAPVSAWSVPRMPTARTPARSSRPWTSPASPTCSSAATPPPARWRSCPRKGQTVELNEALHAN